jgi:carboxyl-terminal processing protease
MRLPSSVVLILAAVLGLGFSGSAVQAQQTTQNLTAAQQVISRYVLPASAIPTGLQQIGVSSLDNVLVAALAEDPVEIQKIIDRGRLDGIEQDFLQTGGANAQIQLQISLYRDSAGAAADVPDPSLLSGQGAKAVSAPSFGDLSAGYATEAPSPESANIVFAIGRLEVLVSEVGPAGSTNQADIVPLARLVEMRVRQNPLPPPTTDELAILQTETMPEPILQDAYNLLLQNYLTKLPPSQLLAAAWTGATKALTDAGVSGLPAAPTISASDGDAAWAQFLPAYQALEKLAPSSISAKDLVYAAATEMYNNLNCHTTFFDPPTYSKEVLDLKGAGRARLGISVGKFDSSIAITAVEPGSPAEQAGLKAGDVIQAIDGQIPASSLDKLSTQLAGPAGSSVTLTVQRSGADQPLDISVVRQVIRPTVEQHRILPGGIGYIQFNDFTDGDEAVTDISRALSDFAAAGVNSWILDLRENGGGSELTLKRVAGLFVPDGSLLVTQTEQDGTVTRTRSVGTPPPGQKSMVLLIGKDTASAAEIFAQSMEDLGRVTLVGDTTSGCVNGGLPLGLLDGSGVFVSTIDVRAGPNRVPLEKVGVMPDLKIPQSLPLILSQLQSGSDPVLAAAIDLFTGAPIPPLPVPSTTSSQPMFATLSRFAPWGGRLSPLHRAAATNPPG